MPAFSKHVRVKDNINIFKEIQNKYFYKLIREIKSKTIFSWNFAKKKKIIKIQSKIKFSTKNIILVLLNHER